MPFGEAKRRFLVRVLGEARTKALEDALPKMERALEEAGIGWKSVDAQALRSVICAGPDCEVGYADMEATSVVTVAPTGGAVTFEEVEAEEEAREEGYEVEALTGTLNLIIDNIMTAPDLEAQDKQAKLNQAVSDFQVRLGSVGEKSAQPATPPSAPYVDLLGTRTGTKAVDKEGATAIKELRSGGAPAAGIVADLLEHGAVEARG